MSGIHISRGVTPRIPAGGLVIGSAGATARMELQLDTCIHWLEIALKNLAGAKNAHALLLKAASCAKPDFSSSLDLEFQASLQATVAAATFFEALYAATLDRGPSRAPLKFHQPERRTPRYAVVAEQLRKAFGLKKQGTANLRSVLREIYRFRDEAVHPSAKFTDPVLHPQLQVGVERRFIMFSYQNALQLVRAALAFSKILSARDLTKATKGIQEFASYLKTVCSPLYTEWEERYGVLLDAPS